MRRVNYINLSWDFMKYYPLNISWNDTSRSLKICVNAIIKFSLIQHIYACPIMPPLHSIILSNFTPLHPFHIQDADSPFSQFAIMHYFALIIWAKSSCGLDTNSQPNLTNKAANHMVWGWESSSQCFRARPSLFT